MKDNWLRVFLFMYILSGSLAAVDILIAGPLNITITTMDGITPAGPQISAIWAAMQDNTIQQQMIALGEIEGDSLQLTIQSLELWLSMSVEMLKLASGTMAFEILTVFGVPWPITAIIQGVYTILLIRGLIAYMPAISGAIRALVQAGHTGINAVRAAGGAFGGLGR